MKYFYGFIFCLLLSGTMCNGNGFILQDSDSGSEQLLVNKTEIVKNRPGIDVNIKFVV